MTDTYIERELKFDVASDFVVPDVAALLPAGGRVESETEHLRSVYFDTADHALLAAEMTLRHRRGTTDAGWQLKVPHPPFREEIRIDDTPDANARGDDIPPELRDLLVGVGRGRPLVRIAEVTTERRVTRLVDADGGRLAEIDDDRVHASGSGDVAVASSWREVEVELGDDDLRMLHRLGKRLRGAGATPSRSSSKLARTLPARSEPPAAGKRRAGTIAHQYVVEQQRAILSGDLALRRGSDAVIHKTRVATRRLRSTLRVFADLFDADRAASLDTELQWYAGLLGAVRDCQVLRARLDVMVDNVDETLLLGPVRSRIDRELRAEQTEHWERLQGELISERYLALLEDLANWVAKPPFTAQARRPAATLTKHVQRAERKVSRRLQAANAARDVDLLHRTRKAAKRARYAAEVAEPVIGAKTAARHAKRYQRLQDLLGEHQDSIVSAQLLRRLGAKVGVLDGENGFAFGVLHEREERNARTARRKARRTARKYR